LKRSILGISVGVFLTAVCWQLSALLAARPGDAVDLSGVLVLSFLGLFWIALLLAAAIVLRGRAR